MLSHSKQDVREAATNELLTKQTSQTPQAYQEQDQRQNTPETEDRREDGSKGKEERGKRKEERGKRKEERGKKKEERRKRK
jgi:hypothetical protein